MLTKEVRSWAKKCIKNSLMMILT